jgi:hypothetical protein
LALNVISCAGVDPGFWACRKALKPAGFFGFFCLLPFALVYAYLTVSSVGGAAKANAANPSASTPTIAANRNRLCTFFLLRDD